MNLFIVTVIGAGIDTEVHVEENESDALSLVDSMMDEFVIKDPYEVCLGCYKGYSKRAKCDIEIEIHDVMFNRRSMDEKVDENHRPCRA